MATTTKERELDAHSSSCSSYRQFISSLITELALALDVSDHSLNPLSSTDQSVKHILLTLHALFPDELLPALDILDRRLVLRCSIEVDHTTVQNETRKPSQDRSQRAGLDDTSTEGISRTYATVDTTQAERPLHTVLVDQKALREHNTLLQEQLGSQTNKLSARSDSAGNDLDLQANTKISEHVVQRDTESDEQLDRREHKLSEPVVERCTKPMRAVYYVRSGRQQSNPKSKWRDATAESTAHYEVRLLSWNCSCPAFAFLAVSASVQHVTTPTNDTNIWQIGSKSLGRSLPMCKHILACVLVDRCPQLTKFVEDMSVSTEEVIGWAAGYGD